MSDRHTSYSELNNFLVFESTSIVTGSIPTLSENVGVKVLEEGSLQKRRSW
jgi:hypothetical protein